MKRFVNGDETDLIQSDVVINQVGDRWIVRTKEGAFSALGVRAGEEVLISFKGRQYRIQPRTPKTRASTLTHSGELRAPMPGQIVDIRHQPGDTVKKGDTILVLEAMKTQQPFTAPFDGIVDTIGVAKGDQVVDGMVLAIVRPQE